MTPMDSRRGRRDRNTGDGCRSDCRENDLFNSGHCSRLVSEAHDQGPTLLASILKRNGTVPLIIDREIALGD
jgi:hypothetical protein